MKNCIFCNIINKESPATVVFEDDICMVIVPIDPISKGHVLLIPKKHAVNILDVDDEILSHLSVVAKHIGKRILEGNDSQAMNLLHAAGEDAQQSVFHFHYHIVPRYKNDELDLWFRNKI